MEHSGEKTATSCAVHWVVRPCTCDLRHLSRPRSSGVACPIRSDFFPVICMSLADWPIFLAPSAWMDPAAITCAHGRRGPPPTPLLPAVLCAAAYLPGHPRPWFVLRGRLLAAAASTLPLLASPPRDGWSVGAAAALIASIVMARGRLAGSITPCGPP